MADILAGGPGADTMIDGAGKDRSVGCDSVGPDRLGAGGRTEVIRPGRAMARSHVAPELRARIGSVPGDVASPCAPLPAAGNDALDPRPVMLPVRGTSAWPRGGADHRSQRIATGLALGGDGNDMTGGWSGDDLLEAGVAGCAGSGRVTGTHRLLVGSGSFAAPLAGAYLAADFVPGAAATHVSRTIDYKSAAGTPPCNGDGGANQVRFATQSIRPALT